MEQWSEEARKQESNEAMEQWSEEARKQESNEAMEQWSEEARKQPTVKHSLASVVVMHIPGDVKKGGIKYDVMILHSASYLCCCVVIVWLACG